MSAFLKIVFVSLLLVLAVAVGTEVAALHHKHRPAGRPALVPVVVRKSLAVPPPHRSVHAVRRRAG